MERNELHDYQNFIVEHILENRSCGLFIDMGLGKTVSTLTAVDTLMYEELEINHVLVVAPKRVVETVWEEETRKWTHLNRLSVVKVIGPERARIDALKQKADIHLISRDNLVWMVEYYDGKFPFDMLVLDESSSFKSNKTQRFKAARTMRVYMKRVVALTGTPSPNSLLDLWPQIYLLDKGQRLERTFTAYRNTYFRPGRSNGHIVFNYELLPGCDKLIHKKINDICVSMKSLDYIKMPEEINNFILVKLSPEVKKQYDEFEKSKVLELTQEQSGFDDFEIPVLNAAALSNKLLQFANGAVYDENRNVHNVHDFKIDALLEIIEDANGQPVMVAYSFIHDLTRLKVALAKYKPRELKTASDINDWNAGKILVVLVHPASVGHGLNLQSGGNIIVFFGLTWSLELYMQLIARLLRQGQKSSFVVINHLVSEGTHDEDVVKAIKTKSKGQNSLLKAVKARINKYINNYSDGYDDFSVHKELN